MGSMEKNSITMNEYSYSPAYFQSKAKVNLQSTDFEELYHRMIGDIYEAITNYNKNGSGWVFKKVIRLDIYMVELVPIRGNSFIPLPKVLADKKANINMENEDNQCFK